MVVVVCAHHGQYHYPVFRVGLVDVVTQVMF